MGNSNDFIIIDGMLRGYRGEETEVVLPDGIREIWYHAFSGRSSIKKLVIPESVTWIADNAFDGCKGLADEQGFVIVRNKIFGYYGQSKDVEIPEGVVGIAGEAFAKTRIEKIRLSESVTEIGSGAFWKCFDLTEVVLCEGLERIGHGAFASCGKLTSITIPESVRMLEENVFSGCESLREVRISPRTIETLGAACVRKVLLTDSVLCAFLRDSFIPENKEMEQIILAELNLKKTRVRLLHTLWEQGEAPAIGKLFSLQKKLSVDEIDEWIEKCGTEHTAMKAALLETKNRLFTPVQVEDHYRNEMEKELGFKERTLADWRKIFAVNTTEGIAMITKYKGKDECVSVPGKIGKYEGVILGEKAFYRCEGVQTVYIEEGVRGVCDRVFWSCPSLKEVHLPMSVEWIHKGAIGKKVKIYAPTGSAAEAYAKENKNPFEAE
jgi:hypothetical protein